MGSNRNVLFKNSKGITLIALVITIVVLLILASVSIAMLTGDNGILTQANEAKEKTTYKGAEEKVKLSIMGARADDGQMTVEELSKEVELQGGVLTGTKFPVEIQMDGYIFIVGSNGKITLKDENTTDVIVEQVTDKNAGILEKEDENTYIINSIEDLIFLAYDVSSGNDNYEGKTVKLGLSLDFNSTKSYVEAFRTDYGKYGYNGELKKLLTTGNGFKSIGTTSSDEETKNWLGTFDGQGNTIYNLYIDVMDKEQNGVKIGLFSNNFGTINNLKLLNVNLRLESNNGFIAGISGQNSMTGSINNCIVSGNIENYSKKGAIGGITCWCSGKVSNCGNLANIVCKTSEDNGETCVGGIYTSGSASTRVYNCYNLGLIDGISSKGDLLIGGITGILAEESEIKNCYNRGKIRGKAEKTLRIGGIVGHAKSKILNAYSTGKIELNNTTTEYIGMIAGSIYSGNTSNLYYLKQNSINGFGEIWNTDNIIDENMRKTEEEMKQNNFVELLNKDNDKAFKQDINNINDSYPILNWQ